MGKDMRKCRKCGKPLSGLEGVYCEFRQSDGGWKALDVPLCKKHQAAVWQAVRDGICEAVNED